MSGYNPLNPLNRGLCNIYEASYPQQAGTRRAAGLQGAALPYVPRPLREFLAGRARLQALQVHRRLARGLRAPVPWLSADLRMKPIPQHPLREILRRLRS